MPVSIKDQPYDEFFENSITGFEQQLYSLITNRRNKDDKRVLRIYSDSALYDAMKAQGKQKINFPFITTQLGSLTENQDGYNQRELKRAGIHIKIPKDVSSDLEYLVLHPNPVKLSIQVRFIAHDERDVLFFSKRWYESIKNYYFNYIMMIYDYPIQIKVTGDPSITYPELAEIVSDTGNMFLAETSEVELRTYIMTTDKVPAIKKFVVSGYGLSRDQNIAQVINGQDKPKETFFRDDSDVLKGQGYEFTDRKDGN